MENFVTVDCFIVLALVLCLVFVWFRYVLYKKDREIKNTNQCCRNFTEVVVCGQRFKKTVEGKDDSYFKSADYRLEATEYSMKIRSFFSFLDTREHPSSCEHNEDVLDLFRGDLRYLDSQLFLVEE
jgi:hypothetical protein